MGFTINKTDVKPNPEKVEAIKFIPAPTSVKEVRSFIGCVSFYRRLIPGFSRIAEPLINLIRKYAKFKWSKECQSAFDFLKESLTVVPLLAYPDPNKPYTLYTDCSEKCLGAVLTQPLDEDEGPVLYGATHEKPLYFLSHNYKLSPSQTKWPTCQREMYAISYALQKLDPYLHNAEFTIKTDHRPLKYVLESPLTNKQMQLWALELSNYNCKVEYIPGKADTCGDLLSRVPADHESPTADLTKTDNQVDDDFDDRCFKVETKFGQIKSPRLCQLSCRFYRGT